MTVHIIKLCVGAQSVDDLEAWQTRVMAAKTKAGAPALPEHVTRMAPKRRDEVLAGGSIYWVIKGMIRVRQRILDLEPRTDPDGTGRCAFILDPELNLTRPASRAAFQGWRYLKPEAAPPDLIDLPGDAAGLPDHVRVALLDVGAW